MRPSLLLPLVLAGVFAPTLSGAGRDVRFGLTASLNLPGGDLKDMAKNDMNFGYGALVEIHAGNGHVWTPRLDWVSYPGKTTRAYDPRTGYFDLTGDLKQMNLGLDYQFYASGKPKGFYFLLGLSNQKWDLELKGRFSNGAVVTLKDDASKLTAAFGLGWKWNDHFAAGIRAANAEVDLLDAKFKAQVTTFELRVTF